MSEVISCFEFEFFVCGLLVVIRDFFLVVRCGEFRVGYIFVFCNWKVIYYGRFGIEWFIWGYFCEVLMIIGNKFMSMLCII